MGTPVILTDRLLLRAWVGADREPFAEMNANPEVMEHFPSTLSRSESDELVEAIMAGFDRDGFGLWVLELRDDGRFMGFTGLSVPGFEAPFTPSVEVGWRLARWAWGNGYATEAASAALDFGFSRAGLDEVVSLTSFQNIRSQAVMQRLGMTREPADDFEHPRIPSGHRLRPHVLYGISRQQWTARQAAGVGNG
ncbi:MAG: GNAT family N-acetyltransferase [Acidimicrobiales bacterium]